MFLYATKKVSDKTYRHTQKKILKQNRCFLNMIKLFKSKVSNMLTVQIQQDFPWSTDAITVEGNLAISSPVTHTLNHMHF